MKVKNSYGIICYQKCQEGILVVFIRKRYSHAFGDIVCGNYENDDELRFLLTETTVNEKVMLQEQDYSNLWRFLWVGNKQDRNYANLQSKFIVSRRKPWFYEYLGKAESIDIDWELPKGRKESKESCIDCAMREFEEETGISKFFINVDLASVITHEKVAVGKRYKSMYYVAEMLPSAEFPAPSVTLERRKQAEEICNVRLINADSLQLVVTDKSLLFSVLQPAMEMIKRSCEL